MATDPNQTPDLNQPANTQKAAPLPPPQQGFTLLALVGILGLVLVFLALGYWVITQDFGLAPRLLLGAAGICLALFFWFNPGSLGSIFTTKGVRYGGNTIILIAALIGIVIVLNLLASRFVLAQADLTSNGQYTLSDQSQQIVQNLQQNVTAHAFFTNQNANRDQAQQLLRQYKALSSKFNYEMVDPSQDPLKARDYQISQDGTVVFELDATHRQSVFNVSETDFTGALITLLNPTEHTLYFLTGHGERTTAATGDTTTDQESYSTLSGELVRERYVVNTLDLSKVDTIAISGTTTLVIAGAQRPLSSAEIGKISKFLDAGGRLMVLGESPFQNTNLQSGQATVASLNQLLARYGTSLGLGVILDTGSRLQSNDPSVIAVNSYQTAVITRNLNGIFSVFRLADAVYTDQPVITDTNVTRTPLLLSSNQSALYSQLDSTGQSLDPNKSTPGPFNLAVSLEYGQAGSADVTPGRKHTRIVVFGDSDFAVNGFLTGQYANGDLFLNSVNWLNEADQLSGVRPKTTDTRFLTLTPVDQNVIFYSSVLVLPIVVLVIGGVIWWRRR